MKKIYIILFTIFCSLFPINSAYAQTNTPAPTAKSTPTPKTEESFIDKQINNLKERIASRVAELKLVEKRGVIGTVSQASNTQITITDIKGKTRFIDVDELTKFSSPSAKTAFGISDLSKGTKIGVLGLYNKQSERILARYVNVVVMPTILVGKITSVESKEFRFYVSSDDKKETGVDVENTTKTQVFSQENGTQKGGFSKLQPNQKVYVFGYPNDDDPDLITADRIIVFPDLSQSSGTNNSAPTKKTEPSDTPTPTSRTTRKLSPTTSQ